jgi:hypothetical protein
MRFSKGSTQEGENSIYRLFLINIDGLRTLIIIKDLMTSLVFLCW